MIRFFYILFFYLTFISFSLQAQSQVDSSSAHNLAVEKCEIPPVYPGGDQAILNLISSNIKYPRKARNKGITGTSYVSFIVDTEGYVVDIKIKKSSGNELLDKEAMRVITLLERWTPGIQDDKKVRVIYTLPIRFVLHTSPGW
ncbi:MAG: energy transducer TonB [Bacteroidia bacterium]|nr:energy transducer TonB [Bacteroidia bacterium]